MVYIYIYVYEYLNNIIHVLSLSYDSPFRPNGQKTMVLPTSRTKSTFAISSLAGSWRHTCTRDRWMMADLLFMEQPPKKDGKVIGDSLLSIDDINLVYYHLWYQFSVLSSMYHHLWNIFIDYIYQYIIDSSIFFTNFCFSILFWKANALRSGHVAGKPPNPWIVGSKFGGRELEVFTAGTPSYLKAFLLVAMYSTRFVGCRSFIWIHTYIHIYI